MCSRSQPEERHRHVLLRSCLVVVLQRRKNDIVAGDGEHQTDNGLSVFTDFVQQNEMCFWNSCLVKSVTSLEFRGCLMPLTLLISGTEFALEVIRSAWARRVLRPPKGYVISKLGDMSLIEMRTIPQTQFAPLSEALCKVVVELNAEKTPATARAVASRLEESFPEMEVPSQEILYRTLGGLIKERKLYHTGEGYFVVSPDTYRQRALSPLCERQMLMTNEEAIVRLHGERRERSLAIQVDEADISITLQSPGSLTQLQPRYSSSSVPSPDWKLKRSNSIRLLRIKGHSDIFSRCSSFKESSKKHDPVSENIIEQDCQELHKSEKQSMLTKLLRRMQSLTDKPNKHVTFSAQFPPEEWFETVNLHCHSVATQTQAQVRKVNPKASDRYSFHIDSTPLNVSWEESDPSDNKASPDIFSAAVLRRSTDLENYSSRKRSTAALSRHGTSKSSPSHRLSHGGLTNYSKRHRHRRSSSESPKVEKSKTSEVRVVESCSKVINDSKMESAKTSQSSLNGFIATSSPKAIISPCSVSYKQPQPCVIRKNPTSGNVVRVSELSSDFQLPSEPITSNNALPRSTALVSQISSFNKEMSKKHINSYDIKHEKDDYDQHTNSESSEMKISLSETNSESSVVCTGQPKREQAVRPLSFSKPCKSPKIDNNSEPIPNLSSPKEVVIDNSVNVEVALEKCPPRQSSQSPGTKPNVSTTVSQTVTEETTVTKGSGNSKVITVTSITTSLSHGALKDLDKNLPDLDNSSHDIKHEKSKCHENDLNQETQKGSKIIDCSCNIVTQVK